MRKIVKISISLLALSLVISGCSRKRVSPNNIQKDAFYYKNINFGQSRGRTFEKGIKDGCKTGEGVFTKDYSLSSRDKNYFDGWILGRSKCKQILPNEGTILEQQKSRQRAEYQIRKMKMEQEMQPSQEGFIDSLLNENNNIEVADEIEY